MEQLPKDSSRIPHDFPSTHWSTLLTLNDPSHPEFRRHLESLVERYWKPVYCYLCNLRRDQAQEARDMTQDFFARLLEKRYLEHLNPDRGSFRGFLKTALKNFVRNIGRSERTLKRGGGARPFRFEEAEDEWRHLEPVAEGLTPEEVFDRQWASGLLLDATRELETVLADDGRALDFDLFREYYLDPSGLKVRPGTQGGLAAPPPESVSYDDLARRHGISADDVRMRLRHARQVMKRLLEDRVREYLDSGDDVQGEIGFLLSD